MGSTRPSFFGGFGRIEWIPAVALLLTVVLVAAAFAPDQPHTGPPRPSETSPTGRPTGIAHPAPSLLALPATARSADRPQVSEVDEAGTLVEVVAAGAYPYFPGVDPVNGYVYVPDLAWDSVTVLNGTTQVANVTVAGGVDGAPYSAAYDPVDGEVYVTIDDAGKVVVLNGTVAVANISVPNNPIPVAFDPADGYMYVGEYGADKAAVLNGTTVVGTVSLSGPPLGAAYDPADREMYFADGSVVDIVNGTHLVANVSQNGSNFQFGMAYDSATQEMDVSNDFGNNITCIAGTSIVASIGVTLPGGLAFDSATSALYAGTLVFNGTQYISSVAVVVGGQVTGHLTLNDATVSPGVHGLVYDPPSASLVVASGPRNVSVFSTVLGLDPLTVTPAGMPALSADVGQARNFSTVLWAVGNGTLSDSFSISPTGDWECGAVSWNASALGPDPLRAECTPERPGAYVVWANVTDGLAETVSVATTVTVFADPIAVLQPRIGGRPATAADVGVTVDFWVNVTGGSGNFSYALSWAPLDYGSCASLLSSNDFQCVFPVPAGLDVQGFATDGNGVTNATRFVPFAIVAGLLVGPPTASLPSADVGQTVRLNASVFGGTGVDDSFAWSGLSSGVCTGAGTDAPVCAFPSAGTYPIQLLVRDSGGGEASSSTLVLTVDPALQLFGVNVSHEAVDAGQTTMFSATAVGGLPPYTFHWNGLPTGCPAAPSGPDVNCTIDSPAPANVTTEVTDANGATVNSTSPAGVTVYAALTVGVPTGAPAVVHVGDSMSLQANASGGAPPLAYAWTGLPTGCASSGPAVSCQLSASGSYTVRVVVTDGTGIRQESPPLSLDVGPAPGAATPAFSNVVLVEAAAGIGFAVVVVATLVLLFRRRAAP